MDFDSFGSFDDSFEDEQYWDGQYESYPEYEQDWYEEDYYAGPPGYHYEHLDYDTYKFDVDWHGRYDHLHEEDIIFYSTGGYGVNAYSDIHYEEESVYDGSYLDASFGYH